MLSGAEFYPRTANRRDFDGISFPMCVEYAAYPCFTPVKVRTFFDDGLVKLRIFKEIKNPYNR